MMGQNKGKASRTMSHPVTIAVRMIIAVDFSLSAGVYLYVGLN